MIKQNISLYELLEQYVTVNDKNNISQIVLMILFMFL